MLKQLNVNKVFFLFLILLITAEKILANTVIVSWDPNSEDDLAGYRIYYGTNSRSYSESVYVGNVTSYRIEELKSDRQYFFSVTAIDLSGNESGFSGEIGIYIPKDEEDDEDDTEESPSIEDKVLKQLAYNYPNPFKVGQEHTAIRYELLNAAEITIKIYDVNSNLVRTLVKRQGRRQGEHTEDLWDGKNRHGDYVSNGVYFCAIETENEQKVIKIAVSNN